MPSWDGPRPGQKFASHGSCQAHKGINSYSAKEGTHILKYFNYTDQHINIQNILTNADKLWDIVLVTIRVYIRAEDSFRALFETVLCSAPI